MELAHEQDSARRPVSVGARRAAEALEREFLPAFLVLLLATALLARLPRLLAPDTWLALVAGREIWQVGLPEHDSLTVWTLGEAWVDQQWLGQLGLYALHSLGGARLALTVNALVVVAAFVAVLALARARGGSATSTALVGLICLIVIAPSTALRTETVAHLLFAALLWLLLRRREPSLVRVGLVALVLVIWANLHGSVLLGAGLAAGFGVAETLGRRGTARRRLPAMLLLAAPALAFASPYALSLPGYYTATAGNSMFPELLTEWRPTSITEDWGFFLLAFAATALVARFGARLTRFEWSAFGGLLLLGLVAQRYTVWFAFYCAAVLPSLADEIPVVRRIPSTRRPRVLAGSAAVAMLLAVAAWSLSRPAEWYEQQYPTAALEAVRTPVEARPRALVLASERYADWILWKIPEARGRLLYDARFELLGDARLRDLVRLTNAAEGWRTVVAPAEVLVLEPAKHAPVVAALTSGGAVPRYEGATLVVLERPSRAG